MDAATAWAYATALLVVVGGLGAAFAAGWQARGPTVDALRAELAQAGEALRACVERAKAMRDRAQADADAARARADLVAAPPAGPGDARARAERMLLDAAARAGAGPAPGGGPAG